MLGDEFVVDVPMLVRDVGFGKSTLALTLFNYSELDRGHDNVAPVKSASLNVSFPISLDLSRAVPVPSGIFAAVYPEKKGDQKQHTEYRYQTSETNRDFAIRFSFVDPSKELLGRILLIIMSTLFGAGISALFEAFIAGGVRRVSVNQAESTAGNE